MERIRRFVEKYREQLAYLFFGGVATVVNIGVYGLMHGLMDVHSDLANAVAWAVSVALAYVTNRKWVFRSRTRGRAMAREFGAFVAGRLITGLMDQGIMHLATQVVGPRFIPAAARKHVLEGQVAKLRKHERVHLAEGVGGKRQVSPPLDILLYAHILTGHMRSSPWFLFFLVLCCYKS